jgi:DNA modification methylase
MKKSENSKKNGFFKLDTIYNGDNLEWIKLFPDDSIDLVYIDPPFFTNKNQETILKDTDEIHSFDDTWAGGINQYIGWMQKRLEEIKRILKEAGTLYLHCDYHANAYLRVKLDQIFGEDKFRNEIIWCYAGGGIPKKDFPRKHDTIFRYVKSDSWTFNVQYRPYGDWTKKHEPRHSLTSGGEKLDMKKGTPINDWWADFTRLTSYHNEWLGYPTQKPEALLERLIEVSSNEDDIVLDAFCGSGTTLAVAKRLKRHFIGIDISSTATKITANRLGMPTSKIVEL